MPRAGVLLFMKLLANVKNVYFPFGDASKNDSLFQGITTMAPSLLAQLPSSRRMLEGLARFQTFNTLAGFLAGQNFSLPKRKIHLIYPVGHVRMILSHIFPPGSSCMLLNFCHRPRLCPA